MSVSLADPDSSVSTVGTVSLSALVDRARMGDADAFGAIYDQLHRSVYRLLFKLTKSHALAEDLTSETFFRALRGIRGSEVRGDYVTAWLLRIARNLAVDHFKAKHSRYEVSVDPYDAQAVNEDVADGPETEVMGSISRAFLLGAVGELPDNQRVCVTARFIDDLSIAETALMMGCTEGAVKQLQLRGIRNLGRRLQRDVA